MSFVNPLLSYRYYISVGRRDASLVVQTPKGRRPLLEHLVHHPTCGGAPAGRHVRGKIHLNVSFAAREYDRTYVHPRSFILSQVSDLCKEPVRILQIKRCSSVARSASRYLKVRHEFCAAQVTHSKRVPTEDCSRGGSAWTAGPGV